jgi:hypothetical protein
MHLLCDWIASGKTVTSFIRKYPQGPGVTTLREWLREYPIHASSYEHARRDGADFYAAQAVDIAHGSKDYTSPQAIAAARLRVETLKWMAAKLKPEAYAERNESHVSGVVSHVITDDDRARALAAYIARQAISEAQSLPEARKLIELKAKPSK